MDFRELDFLFPFLVFAYGALMTLVLNHPKLLHLAEERFSHDFFKLLQAKRALGLACLVIGGLWSLQNIWLSN